jgi:hypothetical protein
MVGIDDRERRLPLSALLHHRAVHAEDDEVGGEIRALVGKRRKNYEAMFLGGMDRAGSCCAAGTGVSGGRDRRRLTDALHIGHWVRHGVALERRMRFTSMLQGYSQRYDQPDRRVPRMRG